MLAWYTIQAFDVFKSYGRAAAKTDLQGLLISHSNDIRRTLRITGITKSGNRLESLLLQKLIKNASYGLSDDRIAQMLLWDHLDGLCDSLSYLFFFNHFIPLLRLQIESSIPRDMKMVGILSSRKPKLVPIHKLLSLGGRGWGRR